MRVPWRKKAVEDNAEIFRCLKLFLAGTRTDRTVLQKHQYVRYHFTAATCYNSLLSARQIAILLELRYKT